MNSVWGAYGLGLEKAFDDSHLLRFMLRELLGFMYFHLPSGHCWHETVLLKRLK